MRIAFGLDGVLADVEQALDRLAVQIFETKPSSMSLVQYRLLWRVVHASENFWEHLDEIEPGTVADLASIASKRRWEVIFLVRRIPTAGWTRQVQSQHWLVANGFDLPSVYTVDHSLAVITPALDLDIVVDSPFEHRFEAADRAFAERYGDPQPEQAAAQQSEVKSIESVHECLRRLCDLDDEQMSWRKRFARKLWSDARPHTVPEAAADRYTPTLVPQRNLKYRY